MTVFEFNELGYLLPWWDNEEYVFWVCEEINRDWAVVGRVDELGDVQWNSDLKIYVTPTYFENGFRYPVINPIVEYGEGVPAAYVEEAHGEDFIYVGLVEYPNGVLYFDGLTPEFDELTINNKTVKSLRINNKLVQSIVRVSDDAVLYERDTSVVVPASISLTADKSVLSLAHNESATLTATVLDDNDEPVEGVEVSFDIVGGDNIDTAVTNANGVATCTYDSEGAGDITVQASVGMILSETYGITSIFYAKLPEQTNAGWGTIDSGIPNLPSSFEMTVDLYTTGVVQGSEQRLFLCPTNTYSGGAQPAQGIWVGFNRPNNVEYGYRNNSSSWFIYQISNMNNNWHTFKVVRNGNSWSYYIDGTLMATKTYSNMSNYNSFTFCWVNWASSYTFKFKNLKIKAL